jgi:hypothetical protein
VWNTKERERNINLVAYPAITLKSFLHQYLQLTPSKVHSSMLQFEIAVSMATFYLMQSIMPTWCLSCFHGNLDFAEWRSKVSKEMG